jgi:hypothetical protein
MYQESTNPVIQQLTKSYRKRQFPLGDLRPIKVDGFKVCIWYLTTLQGKLRKWCSSKCSDQAMAWGYPQSEHGLHVLLARQYFACAGCNFSYMPYIEKAAVYLNRNHPTVDLSKLYTEISFILMKCFKQRVSRENAPEVDHVVPISKGGIAIGLENKQILCYTCHKAKTKIDNSGPRNK